VFTSPTGPALRHGNFRRQARLPALAQLGWLMCTFTTRGIPRASHRRDPCRLRELMDRMGHSSTCAAL